MWINGARLGKDKREALRCGDEVIMAAANDSGDDMGATQGKRQLLKGTKSASVQVGNGDEGRVAEQLRCGICLCMLHKPVTLMPCLHSFCAGCCSDWMRQQQTCPDCRAPCGQVGRSHTLHNVVAAFVEAHPEFLREQEEIERLDGTDRLSEALMHRRSGKMTFQRLCKGCQQMRVDLLS
jgi:E3 ubiquitin-protein ligase CHFR